MWNRNVKQLYCLILLLAFLAAQFTIVLHTSEHGVLEHSHAGKQCEYYLFSKNLNSDTPSETNVAFELKEYKVFYFKGSKTLLHKELKNSKFARAPPSILLT